MKVDATNMQWTRAPRQYTIARDRVEMITQPHTDLWQRTYYHFRNDNAPVLQMETDEKFFSFVVRTEFDTKVRYDQSGIVMYLDSDNWLKAAIEYENDTIQRLGSRDEQRLFRLGLGGCGRVHQVHLGPPESQGR